MEVTALAIEKLKEVIEQEGESTNALRVVAMPSEHGGLQYMLTMENEFQPDDTVLKMDGVDFLMDSDSAPFLEEATIDYVENFGGQVGFVINNPCSPAAAGAAAAVGDAVAAVVAAVAAAATVTRPGPGDPGLFENWNGLPFREAVFGLVRGSILRWNMQPPRRVSPPSPAAAAKAVARVTDGTRCQ